MENEFIELVFHVWKTSSLNSFSLWCLILTKFPWFAWSYNELIELVFHVWKHKCRRSQISDQANPQAAKFLIKQDFVNQAPQGKRVQRKTSSMNSFFMIKKPRKNSFFMIKTQKFCLVPHRALWARSDKKTRVQTQPNIWSSKPIGNQISNQARLR